MKSEGRKSQKIILSGGGTGGSVTPLLAVARELLIDNDFEFVFVGTKSGPEQKLVEAFDYLGQKIKFVTIPAGKFRRYFSWQNLVDIFRIFHAFLVSYFLLRKEKPDLFFSAGGFVGVPLAWAAYFLSIPIIIHQQDVRPGLANRLVAPLARLITVTFEKSLKDYGSRAVWTGNPSRQAPEDSGLFLGVKQKLNLDLNKPLLVITGGGTGSKAINDLAFLSAKQLSEIFQVVHLTGSRKEAINVKMTSNLPTNYKTFEFIANEDAFLLLGAADIVVSRCGLATLTELCELKKTTILIPIPNSHQEDNAAVFRNSEAAVVLNQIDLNPYIFSSTIINLFHDEGRRQKLSLNISRLMKREATTLIASFIKEII